MSAIDRSACRIQHDADLRPRNSFGVPARAALLVEVDHAAALPGLLASAPFAGEPLLVLGGGSNLLFAADPDTPVIALASRQVQVAADDGERVVVRADAGVPWHGFVMQVLAQGLHGMENLALIPGTVGAAPIQNIGAYGVEVGDSVHAVEVFDRVEHRLRRLESADCGFGYRDSVFKRQPERHVVTAVEFTLSRRPDPRIEYAGLAEELHAMGIAAPTPADVAAAVIALRRRKLPDPAVIGNAGSFFKNPVVPVDVADALVAAHPRLPTFGAGEGQRKLSAAWLIDACGWKGHRDGDAGVSATHALVLVNHGQATGAQLLGLARRVAASVQARFDVRLEPEPRIIGATW